MGVYQSKCMFSILILRGCDVVLMTVAKSKQPGATSSPVEVKLQGRVIGATGSSHRKG